MTSILFSFIYLEMPDAYGSSPLMTASRMGLTEYVHIVHYVLAIDSVSCFQNGSSATRIRG